jgi:hypothetical protein
MRDLALARPRLFFWFFYPFLVAVGLLASLLIARS